MRKLTTNDLNDLQYWKVGEADGMALYEREMFYGTTRGSKSWAVDFGQGLITTFADYPSLDRLRKLEYPVNTNRKRWKRKPI